MRLSRRHRPTRRRGRSLSAVAAVAVALLALGACSGGGDGGAGYVPGDGTVTAYAVADRKAAPAVEGPTLEGPTLSLASLRGKIVVLNFWGSWCGPCRVEGPFLQTMAIEYKAKGVQFVGVDLQDGTAEAKRFLAGIGSAYPNLIDGYDGRITLLFNGIVPPKAIPSTLIIDPQGRIAVRIIGPTTAPRLAAALDPLVAEGA